MVDEKISQLAPVGSLSGAALIPIVQGGVNTTATASQVAALGGGGGGAVASVSGRTGAILLSASDISGLGSSALLTAGATNGVATLDGTGHVPLAQIPSSLLGGNVFQGTWDANANNPILASGVGTSGNYYIVSVAGNANLNGITTWNPGDQALFYGGVWTRIASGGGGGTLTNTGVASGTYINGSFTVGGDGRLTAAANGPSNSSGFSTIVAIGSGTTNPAGTPSIAGNSTVIWNSASTGTKITVIDPAGPSNAGQDIVVKDAYANAGVAGNNIMVAPSSGTIEGGSNLTLNVGGQSVTLRSDGVSNWIII